MRLSDQEKRVLSEIARVHGSTDLLSKMSRTNMLVSISTPELDLARELARKQTLDHLVNLLEEFRSYEQ